MESERDMTVDRDFEQTAESSKLSPAPDTNPSGPQTPTVDTEDQSAISTMDVDGVSEMVDELPDESVVVTQSIELVNCEPIDSVGESATAAAMNPAVSQLMTSLTGPTTVTLAQPTSVLTQTTAATLSSYGPAVAGPNRHIVIKSVNGEQFTIALPTSVVPAAGEMCGSGGAFIVSSSQCDDGLNTEYTTVDSSAEHSMTDAHVIEVGGANSSDCLADNCSACLVCGDKGSGFHYSVYSCEGCKGFFKRTVQKNMSYVCKENGMCEINKVTRNSCQHCRFRRCLDVGMKKEAVREDRTPGGKHRAKRFRLDDGELTGVSSTVYQLTDWNNTEEDEQLISQVVDARPDIVPQTADTSRVLVNSNQVDINEFIQLSYTELRFIIEWAKRVPGFSQLLLEDQMALLKSSFMELIVLRLAFRSLDCNGAVRFTSSLLLSPSQCVHLGWCEDLVTCTLDFLTKLRTVLMDHTEFCLLSAVLLTYPDASGLVDRESVSSLHNTLLDLLHKYSTSRYPELPHRCASILLRLPSLRTISAKASEKFLSCSLDCDVKMDHLVSQMIK